MKIDNRAAIALLLVVLALLGGGVVGVIATHNVEAKYTDLADYTVPQLIALQDIEASMSKLTREGLYYALFVAEGTDPADAQSELGIEEENVTEAITALDRQLAVYRELRVTGEEPEEEQLAEELINSSQMVISLIREIQHLKSEGISGEPVLALLDQLETAEHHYEAIYKQALAIETDELQADREIATRSASASILVSIIGPAIGLGLVAGLGLLLSRETRNRLAYEQRLQEHNAELQRTNSALEIARYDAEEASRVKSEFLATMSHELRTPLNAIIGFTEIMLAGIGDIHLQEKARHMTQRILANGQELLSMIDDILDLAKIEANHIELVEGPLSVQAMLANLRGQLSSLAEKKGLDFIVEVDPALPETILADEARLRHVLINLISNAFKFTDQGRVVVKAGRLDAQRWTLSVEDTGIGIAPHALAYIFDPFRQADGSYHRAYGGTGLGLAIVKDTLTAMDGTIRVESTVGQGSTFTATLPLVVDTHERIKEIA